ncbi:MAG TPA: adenylate/guanylate cyclase domain-containing protein [Acidimicrobiia bacterium]|nr:adenylate/guanylate cyclase domain-containing protein [Acidimicrobiia bacterium]
MNVSPQPYLPRMVRDWDEDAPGRLHQCLEGSMVFVDISGFTAMSERLAKHGKLGAEELTAVIAATFHELLAAAYSFGASLLKFGGDALLLFFTGDEHALRGCAAARAMQQKLDEVGVCVTSAGKVTLRMSVGIHSGMFDFFLVGGSHRELIVSGPAATRTVEMEAAARAGQVLLSPETALAIPAENRGRPSGPGVLLRGAIEVERAGRRHVESPPDQLAQFVPIGLCQLLLSGEVEPEHRPATVAFLHYHGLDDLIQIDGAEVSAERLDSLIRAVQEAVDARAVTFLATDIATNGGKVIITAGVPSTTGNDEEEMLLALRQVISGEPALPISVGVSSGRIFAGDVGTPYRRTYTVMGDTVNLAARLMARAPVGEIYATAEVVAGSRTTFEVDHLEPFLVKGKKLPVNALSVGEPKGSKSQREAGGLPLIGRDQEMALLNTAWEKARTGNGKMVELAADQGMGKSRLLDEFLTTSQPERVIRAECRLYQAATSYFPFRELLGEAWGVGGLEPEAAEKTLAELVDTVAPELRPWLSLIGLPLGLEIADSVEASQLEDQFRPARTIAAIGALLEATITDPVMFVVEDTHWMDEPSRGLLAGLVSGLERDPWMFVLTRSLGEEGFVAPATPSVTRIELHPLGLDEAKDLIFIATEDAPLSQEQVEMLARQADGNPLFLIELLQALRHTGSLEEIPQSVEAMIATRIDTLPQSDRNVLRRLSVLGTGFRLEQVSAVLGDEGDSPQDHSHSVERLSAFMTVDESGWVEFHHSLIREVAYDGLPFKTRERLHARVGDATFAGCRGRPEEYAEILSIHYFHAKRWSRTWRFSRMAGDRAREIYANHEAADFYERALIAARRLDWVSAADRAEVLTALAGVLYEAGLYDEAITALRDATRVIDHDPVARADLHRLLARAYQKLGKPSRGLRETAMGLKVLESSDEIEARRARARLKALRAGILSDLLRPRMTLKVGLQAVEEASECGELEALARAYTYIDEAYQTLGQRELANHEPLALEIFEDLGDLSGIALIAINLGVQAYADGKWDEAIAMYSRAQEVSRKAGNDHAEGAAAVNLGEVLISRGRLDEAQTVLEEARRVLRSRKDVLFVAFAEAQLGRLMMERGHHRSAIGALTKIVDEAIESGQSFIAVDTSVHLADAHIRDDDPETALRVIGVAQELAGEDAALYEVPLERLRAAALVALGRLDEAADYVDHALRSALRQGLIHEEALLLLIRSEIPEVGSESDSEEASRLLRDLGAALPYVYRFPSPML